MNQPDPTAALFAAVQVYLATYYHGAQARTVRPFFFAPPAIF